VTTLALSEVTDEFLAHIRGLGSTWDLGQATEFLVVAATLLDLKAARLLPSAAVEDEEDLALLEARDLLFARLLQYRAYKSAAPSSPPCSRASPALPPLGVARAALRRAAARGAARPRPAAVRPHGGPRARAATGGRGRGGPRARRDGQRPRADGAAARPAPARRQRLVPRPDRDCTSTLEVVARFLGLLELYREGVVSFEQVEALGDLHLRWTGDTRGDPRMSSSDSPGPDAGGLHTVSPQSETAGRAPGAPSPRARR
jgi:segregation and condensation protein A